MTITIIKKSTTRIKPFAVCPVLVECPAEPEKK
jgi:hypothetical protein